MNDRRLKKIQHVIAGRQKDIIVILEDIHDPHNAAAILRTCDALGIQNVWFVFEKETPYNPKKIGKATSSSANKWLDFRLFASSSACIETLRKEKYSIIVSALTDTAQSLEQYADSGKPIAVVMGNEQRGASEKMLQHADYVLQIPMRGFVQSLNVSVAAAILLWEITRQRLASTENFTLDPKKQQRLLEDFVQRAKK